MNEYFKTNLNTTANFLHAQKYEWEDLKNDCRDNQLTLLNRVTT